MTDSPDKVLVESFIQELRDIDGPCLIDDDLQDMVEFAKQGIAEIIVFLEKALTAI